MKTILSAHKSDTRCKSIPPSFCLLLQPIRHQKPLLLLLSPTTHMYYLPTGTVSKSNNVSKSGGKSLHASPDLFFGFRNSLPEKYVLPRSANLNDPTTQLLSSHHHTTNQPTPRFVPLWDEKYRKIVSFMNFFVKLISRNFFVKSISRNFLLKSISRNFS